MIYKFVDDYIELGLDDCKFIINGYEYTAIIKEVTDTHLVVKPVQKTNWKDTFERSPQWKHEEISLPAKSYKKFDLQFWIDGRGCDNSAIGCHGCWESYTALAA